MTRSNYIWTHVALLIAIAFIIPTIPMDAGDGRDAAPVSAGGGEGDAVGALATGSHPADAPDGGYGGADPGLSREWEEYVVSRWGEVPPLELVVPEDPSYIDQRYLDATRKADEFNDHMGWGNAGPPSNGGATPYLASHSRWSGLAKADTRWQDPWGPAVTGYDDRIAKGTHDVVYILINYTNSDSEAQQAHDPATHDPQWWNETMFFNLSAGANTMNTWLTESSYNQFNITGVVASNSSSSTGWYTAQNQRSYYTSKGKDLFKEAMDAADADLDFTQYDSDSNGYIDHVYIVHAGKDAASGGDASDIWSHRAYWWPADSWDGVNVQSYAISAEYSKMGVYCHEFGHDLGLPDLYDTDAAGGTIVVGKYDIMDNGLYNTVATVNKPAHPNAWNKAKLGWAQPVTINLTNNNGGVYRVNMSTMPTNDSTIYRVDINDTNQYFLVENRNTTTGTYDEGLPQSGIIIWHIDEDMPDGVGKDNDGPPDNSYFLVNLETPDNEGNVSNYVSDRNSAAFSEVKGEEDFNPLTSPGTRSNNGTVTDIWIDRIHDNALWNRTLRLLVSSDTDPPAAPTSVVAADTPSDNGHIVDLSWARSSDDGIGDNDVLSYSIYVNQSGAGSGGPYDLCDTKPATGLISYVHQVAGLVDGTLYYFVVRADDGPNENGSGEDSATPQDNVVAPATGFTAIDRLSDQGHKVQLDWTLSADDGGGGLDVAGYDILLNQSGGGAAGPFIKIAGVGPGTTTYTVKGLVDGVTYYFNVTAIDEVPNMANASGGSAAPIDNVARPPGNLTASDAPSDQGHWINLTWNISPDDGWGPDDVTGYEVQMNDTGASSGGPYHVLTTLGPGATSYDVPNLVDKTTYHFRVAALDEVPNRGYTIVSSDAPWDNVVAPPTSPAANDVPLDQGTALNVSWTMSADDGGGGDDVVGYRLYMNSSGTGEVGPYERLTFAIGSAGSTLYSVAFGLDPGVTYFFKASAYDEVPNELNTSVFNGTTLDNLAPLAPTLRSLGTNPINTTTVNFTGTSEMWADVHIFLGVTDIGKATADAAGEYDAPVTLPEGESNVTAVAFDRWGNGPSPASLWRLIVVDVTPPVAVSDTPSTPELNIPLILNGSASHDVDALPEWDMITNYTWRITPGPEIAIQVDPVTLHGSAVVHTFPELGNYTVNLTVIDMANNTAWELTALTVLDTTPPVADAGQNITGADTVLASLDGSGTTDNDPTFPQTGYFNWSYTDMYGETIHIAEPAPNVEPLHLFDVPGHYEITLTVYDRSGNNGTDTTWVHVSDTTRPVADAGPDRTVYAGGVFLLNASGSSDDDPLFPGAGNFTWLIPDPAGTVMRYGLTTTWAFADPADYVVRLMVMDRWGNGDNDTARVTVIEGTPEPLTVEAVTPAANETGVTPDVTVMAVFNKALDEGTLSRTTAFMEDSGGMTVNVGLDLIDDNTTVILDPIGSLDELTSYTVILTTSLTDLAGNRLAAAYTWSFTTKDLLEVSSVTPRAGAVDALPTTEISITFDSELDPATVAAAAFAMEGGPSGEVGLEPDLGANGVTVVLTPDQYLRYGWKYTVTAADTLRSTGGGALDGAFSWNFTIISLDEENPDPALQGVDTDGDGISDLDEVQNGLDPYDPDDAGSDDDGDGLTNIEEIENGTAIDDADSDDDGVTDKEEIDEGEDPNDPVRPSLPATGGDDKPGALDKVFELATQPLYCFLGIIILVVLIGGIAASVASKRKEAERQRLAEEEARGRREEEMRQVEAERVAYERQAAMGYGAEERWDYQDGPALDDGTFMDDPHSLPGQAAGAAAAGGRRPPRKAGGRAKAPSRGRQDNDDDGTPDDEDELPGDDDDPLSDPGDDETEPSGDAGGPSFGEPLLSDDEEMALGSLLDEGDDELELDLDDEAPPAEEKEALGELPDDEPEGTEEGGDGDLPDEEADEEGPMDGEVLMECPECSTSLYVPKDAGSFICPSCDTESNTD